MIDIIKVDTRFDSNAAYCGQNIPVPGWANYIATDSSGNIWAFEYEPSPFGNTTFHIGTGRSARIGIGRLTVSAEPIQTMEKLKPRETPAKNNSPKAPMSKRGANACATLKSTQSRSMEMRVQTKSIHGRLKTVLSRWHDMLTASRLRSAKRAI